MKLLTHLGMTGVATTTIGLDQGPAVILTSTLTGYVLNRIGQTSHLESIEDLGESILVSSILAIPGSGVRSIISSITGKSTFWNRVTLAAGFGTTLLVLKACEKSMRIFTQPR